MEKNDQTVNRPDISEKAQSKERGHAMHWREHVTGQAKKISLLAKGLWEKASGAYKDLFRPEGEVSPLEDIKGAFSHIPVRRKGLKYLLTGLILAVYLFSGTYTVKPGEEAVARIFGKEVRRQITEGLHYHLPWPFEVVEKVNVMEIRRVDVGLTASKRPRLFPKRGSIGSPSDPEQHSGHGAHGASARNADSQNSNPVSSKNQFLTGDENILEIKMIIQYRIKDASDYFFNLDTPDALVPKTAHAAVTGVFGAMRVDNLLTIAKSQIQNLITRKTQNMLDGYGVGLQVVSVNLQEVNPPEEVAQAFRDVASAREEREEKINKAEGYRNTVIPEARGEAHQLISAAEGYREEVINRASGDAEKFSAMLEEYRSAEDITKYRLYLETMEKILAKTKKFVVDSKKERVNLKFVK